MSENQHSNHDPLEEAIRAFQGMPVGERPADAAVLARFSACQGGLSQPSCMPIPSKRRRRMHLIAGGTAAAVLVVGSLAIVLWHSLPQESDQVAATPTPDKAGNVAVQPPSKSEKLESLPVASLQQTVAEAQVIVVATGLDSAPAPPGVPGDAPEVLMRWQVKRVLKGELGTTEFITRTSPKLAAEFIGKEWIIFLTPSYMAGKNQQFAGSHIEMERTVRQLITKEKK